MGGILSRRLSCGVDAHERGSGVRMAKGPQEQTLSVLSRAFQGSASIMQPTTMLCIAFTFLISLAQGRVLLVDDGEPLPSLSPRKRLIAGARSDVRLTAFYRVPAHLWP